MVTVVSKFKLRPVEVRAIPKGWPTHSYKIASEAAVGIEVEVENVVGVGMSDNPVWHSTADNSLRNSGVEFVSSPIKAADAPPALQYLLEVVLNKDCHFSPRTSVHVHLNVQDMEIASLQDLILYYSLFEKLFYKFVGRGRIRNIYCVPITETKLMEALVENSFNGGWYKYTGLNLIPVRGSRDGDGRDQGGQGTIEFRHMHGTFSVDKLCIWIDLITSLKEYVMKSSTKDLRTVLNAMDDTFDFHALLKTIFGEKAEYLKYEGFHELKETLLAVKHAMVSNRTYRRIADQVVGDAPLYMFKG